MNNQRTIIYTGITGLVILGAFALGYVLRDQFSISIKTPTNTNQNVNAYVPTEEESWWYGVGKFQNTRYTNAGCNLDIKIPNAWYLQEEQYTPGKSNGTDQSQFANCFIKFGDNGKYWSLQIVSQKNPAYLAVSEWESKQMQFDIPFSTREFGVNKGLFLKRFAEDTIEQSNMQIAVIATDGWIHTIEYLDKDSGMPRQADFEKLVASIQAHTIKQATQEPEPKSDTFASVNTSTNLYISFTLGFSIEMPKTWHVRTAKDSTEDVKYSDLARSIESTLKPLYYSDGVGPKNENQVSTEGSAIDIGRSFYYNSRFSDYLDATFQKDSYHQKAVTIGNDIPATRVETIGYTTKYNYEYVVLNGDYVYTLSVRSVNATDEAVIFKMLKTFRLL
jgi:hypothetical protein